MKKVINLFLFVIVITFCNAINAAGKISIKVMNSSVVDVLMTEVIQGEKLYIKDYYGTVLYDTTLDAAPIHQKLFNLSKLEDGLYFVEAESEFEIKVTPVLKNEKGVSLVEESTISIFKPVVKIEGGMVSIMLNNPQQTPLDFSIYDTTDNVALVEEKGNQDQLIERFYDFSKMPSDTYYLFFTINNRTFTKKIRIE